MLNTEKRLGYCSATPLALLLAVFFIAPLLLILIFSFMPTGVFSVFHSPTLAQYRIYFGHGYYQSLLWSLGLGVAATACSFVFCYPLAYAMAKVFNRFTWVIIFGVVIALIVPQDVRAFGWFLSLMNGGMVPGFLQASFGVSFSTPLYNVPIIVFGLFYAYSPFMLFPILYGIMTIPDEVRQAAADLGASRTQVLLAIDLPLAMPGIIVGWLLTFALSVGSLVDAKVLSGNAVIVVAQDIETAFNYSQNWPLGSVISVWLLMFVFAAAIIALRRINLDKIMGNEG